MPSAEDLERWVDDAAREGGLGTFALVAYMSGADDPEVARALLALVGRRLEAGRPLPRLLALWVGRRLQAAAGRADGSALPVVGRGCKPPSQHKRERVARIYWGVEERRAQGKVRDVAIAEVSVALGVSIDRIEKVYKAVRRAPLKPVLFRID